MESAPACAPAVHGRSGVCPSVASALAWLLCLATACTAIDPPPYREVVHLKGTPYERGLAHGKAMSSKIRSFYTTILGTSLLPYVNRERPDIALHLHEYRQEKYLNGEFSRLLLLESAEEMSKTIAPEHIEEMKGVADGSGVEYEKILLLNTFLDTVLAVRAVAYVLRLGQAPVLKSVAFGGGLDADGFDNDGDGHTDEKNEGRVTKYASMPRALMAEVPLDATIEWVLADPDGVDPQTVRVQLDEQVFEPGDPALKTELVNEGTLKVTFSPPAPLPAAATVALLIQAGDTSVVTDPPPDHARFMRDERIVFTTKGSGMPPQHAPNQGVSDGRSQPPASAFAVRGTATPDGAPRLAQHFSLLDANTSHKHTVVFVHHPDKGPAFVTVGWAGCIWGMSGMNADGVAAAAIYSDTLDSSLVGSLVAQVLGPGGGLASARLVAGGNPIGLMMRRVLERAGDVEGARAEIAAQTHALGWNVLLADKAGGMMAVEFDSGAVAVPPPDTPKTQLVSYGPDSDLAADRRLGSAGVDDVHIAAHFQKNTKDVMTLPVGVATISAQPTWSSYYFRSLRVFNLTNTELRAGYGHWDTPAIEKLLGHPALVDSSDSMNAVVYEPASLKLRHAMGAVPATRMPFETVDLGEVAP